MPTVISVIRIQPSLLSQSEIRCSPLAVYGGTSGAADHDNPTFLRHYLYFVSGYCEAEQITAHGTSLRCWQPGNFALQILRQPMSNDESRRVTRPRPCDWREQ